MLLGGCGGCGAAGIFPGARVVAGGIVASRGAEVEVVLNVEAPAELKASTAAGVEPLGAARGNCETATGRKPGSGATWTVWKNDWGRWVEVAVSSDVADGSFMICCADCAARATREAASEATARARHDARDFVENRKSTKKSDPPQTRLSIRQKNRETHGKTTKLDGASWRAVQDG